jgi:hypothetical protein
LRGKDFLIGFMKGVVQKWKNDSLGSQVWWCMPEIPALGRLRQEDGEFEAIRAT